MTDSYTEVTSENIFTRTKNSIGGIFFGFLLFLIAFPVLWFNEGRAVKTAKALSEIGNSYTVVSADKVDSSNEAKLIYVNGKAQTTATLSDSTFAVSQPGIHLNRVVEMYQWKEKESTKTEEKLGGTKETTKTYDYTKGWSSSSQNSNNFKVQEGHINPRMIYSGESYTAPNVSLGAFELGGSLKERISGAQKLTLNDSQLANLPSELKSKTKLSNGAFYIGENPASPKVGDYRIRYTYVPSEVTVSVLAKQQGSSFTAYQTSNGKSMMFLRTGTVGPDEIVGQEQASNTTLTWILRGVGMLLMFFGLMAIVAPLRVMSSVIPALGNLVGAAFGMVAFLISLAISAVVIGAAWIFYRPVLGISLLVIAAVLIFLGIKFGKKKATPPPPVAASEPPPAPSSSAPPPIPE